MATVKLRFRPSTVKGKAGVLYYQLCHKQENRQLTTDMRIFPQWWDAQLRQLVILPDNKSIVEDYQLRIENDMEVVRNIIRDLDASGEAYTLADVIHRFQSLPFSTMGILCYMRKEIECLSANGQYGTARNYQRTLNSLSAFLNQKDLPLSSFDNLLVVRYEKWLQKKKVIKNSSSFYMRVLRAVYNKAVKENLLIQRFPFRNVYTGVAKTRKRAEGEQLILQLQQLDLSATPPLAFARDLFVFSYCARGMAFVDMAYLKTTDIAEGKLVYVRRKTGQQLTVHMEPCMQDILARYADKDRPYVFPIITSEDPDAAYRQYQTGLNYYNRQLKGLAKWTGKSMSSYTSRHTWATVARNHHVPLSVISAGMGHTSEKTTLIYLDSLDNAVVDTANSMILKELNPTVSQ